MYDDILSCKYEQQKLGEQEHENSVHNGVQQFSVDFVELTPVTPRI